MRPVLAVGAVTLAACACASCESSTPAAPHAVINDVAVKHTVDSGYHLVAVDGKPVERVQSDGLITYVPLAIVEPGTHTLSLEPRDGSTPEVTTVTTTLEAGKRYRFKRENNSVTVVEDVDD